MLFYSKSKDTFRGERNIAWAPWAAELIRLLPPLISLYGSGEDEVNHSKLKAKITRMGANTGDDAKIISKEKSMAVSRIRMLGMRWSNVRGGLVRCKRVVNQV